MDNDRILIDLYVDQTKLQESLKALRMVALLNEDPALKQLVDLLKVMDATVDTTRAKSHRNSLHDEERRHQQKMELDYMMEQAKQAQKPWDSGAPWNQYPTVKGDAILQSPKVYSSAEGTKKKPFSLKDLPGNWPGKI